jgi:N-acetyl-alpha-D-muramate 1-phosphate uridylyltransferase
VKAELAILAGGLATRLGERTRSLPKSLIEVAGRPFIAWQLERIAASGVESAVVCTGHLGSQIRAFVKDGSAFGLEVAYSDDGADLLGTGGALVAALPMLADCFVVTYGDSYLPFDYRAPLRALVESPNDDGCLAVLHNQGRWDSSNARVEGDRVIAYRKAPGDASFDYIDYGALALRRGVLSALASPGAFGLEGVQTALAARGALRALHVSERFYEIGSETGILELAKYLARKRAD